MFIKCQKFLVVGVSKSGFSAASYILGKGGDCYIYEELKSDKIDESVEKLTELGAKRADKENIDGVLSVCDVVVLSPGVPINHEIAVKAKRFGKRIIGEFGLGFELFVPPTIAVTGTNGKTTTVSMIEHILKTAGTDCCPVGNIGIPVTSKLNSLSKDTVCVAEISSFQLESIGLFCPHIACVTNISPDHIERHYNMENYIFLKKRIMKYQRESEYTVLNFDDSTVREFENETKGKIVWVSANQKVYGAYRENGKLCFNGEYVTDENQLALSGEHNVYNALFAIAATKLMGVESTVIKEALSSFKGVKHRVELISEKNGIKFYNDSKSTNTASTISAIGTMKAPTVLILGGSEKGEKYDKLFEIIKTSPVKHVVITGASRYHMFDAANKAGFYDLTLTSDFICAVKIATMYAKDGDCVLLSPACASFDRFSGYEERGNNFIKTVEELS